MPGSAENLDGLNYLTGQTMRHINRKAYEGASHPDRNAQFEYINAEVLAAQAAGQPVISGTYLG